MDGVPHPLGRTTLSVRPAGSLGVALWGEVPVVVHSGNVLDNNLLMGSFPFPTPLLVFPGITSQADNFSKFYPWFSFCENPN